jgi:hypothetical protein
MPIGSKEASDALRDIQHAERESAVAYGYQKASPHLFLWGVIWVIGYLATYFRPNVWTWPVLVVAGCAGTAWIASRSSSRSASGLRWRYAATFVALYFFFFSFFVIYPPKSNLQAGALFPLLVSISYVLRGIWTSTYRMIVLGVAVGALNLAGYVWFAHDYLLWMAGLGGGALILGGFWLRQV